MRSITIFPLFFFFIYFSPSNVAAQGVFQLWGTTPAGGTSGVGNIYSMDAAGNNFRNRFSIPAINHAKGPNFAKLLKLNDLYYGYTEGGPSVLFEWNSVTNTFTKKIDLEAYGMWGNGNLAVWNNKIYGMSAEVKGGFADGAIFEWDPVTNIFRVKQYLSTETGVHPEGGFVLFRDKFYGMTSNSIIEWDPATNILVKKISIGGSLYNDMILVGEKFYGIARSWIFEWDPITNIYKNRASMAGLASQQNLIFNNGKFYGTTSRNGLGNGGVIFEWDTLTSTCTKRTDIYPIGHYCDAGLTLLNGKFYGTSSDGGATNEGVIFEWDPETNALVKKIDMHMDIGIGSSTSLTLSPSGKLLGMTRGSSTKEVLPTIFEYDPVSNSAVKKIEMNEDISKGAYPVGELAYIKGVFYGLNRQGGLKNEGTLFEWKPGSDGFTKQKNLSDVLLCGSYKGLTVKDNKLYGGIRNEGHLNISGALFEWNPVTDIFSKTDVDIHPYISNKELIQFNDKFYGIGNNSIYEWDPATTTVTLKVPLGHITIENLNATLSLWNGKFYVVFSGHPDNPAGMIYEWNPATNVYALKYNFRTGDGINPYGNLVEKNGLLYGTTARGGANDAGVIFSYAPVSNSYTKILDMTVATGSFPKGGFTSSGQYLYGVSRDGGLHNKGVVFEFDPVAATYTVKHHFNGLDGASPENNNLVRVPAPVSMGILGACTAPLSVLIDNSNNAVWVPLVDFNGDVVAEINANGNNLGLVNYQVYVHNGSVREDATGRLYLNRNLTITPAVQPATPVDIRLYITRNEYETLRDATNLQGQPSGINTIDDLDFFKNGNACSGVIQNTATLIPATTTEYDNGYIITATISSFSSFYFTGKTFLSLPLTLLEFHANKSGADVLLNWKTSNEIQTKSFIVEKSTDGRNFSAIGDLVTRGDNASYFFTDSDALSSGNNRLHYRLKMQDQDGRYSYSTIVTINGERGINLSLYPNPTNGNTGMQLQLLHSARLHVSMIDNSGRIIHRQFVEAGPGSSYIHLQTDKLAAGTYWIEVKGGTLNKRLAFMKK